MAAKTKSEGTVVKTESGENVTIKPLFEEHYRKLLGNRYDSFIRTSVTYLRKSVRINTLKKPVAEVCARLEGQGWSLSPVPWCSSGFWLEHSAGRLDIGNIREHTLGYLYVQEAASMLPPEVMDVGEGQLVLDLCASPGSKSTQIAQLLDGTGLVVCNDCTGARLKPLGLNIQRMGAVNAVVACGDGRRFSSLGEVFDRVLVDAPCSGTGAIRKSLCTLDMWNPRALQRLSRLQLRLLEAGYACLKPGGIIVYSTCSLEPEENEAVVSAFLGRHDDAGILPIELSIARSPAVMEFGGKALPKDVKRCLRIWPQDNDTEGFFVAKIRKPQTI